MASEMKAQEVWVVAEQRAGVLHDVGLELLGKARELVDQTGGRVSALLLGYEVKELIGELVSHGADRVFVADDPRLEPYRMMPYLSILDAACRTHDPDIVLLGSSSMGVELAPRLAARLETGLSAHCIDLQLDDDGKLLQMVPGWGGGVIATIKCPDHRPQMATVMPGVMKKSPGYAGEEEIVNLEVGDDLDVSGPKVLEVWTGEPEGMPLEQAEVVVAGGWGIGGKDGWALLEELASLLGGAVGATRPPLDEGWAEEGQMIGQSGKTIRPRFYIGAGISGVMHHVVGMDEADFVVAINTDPNAPLFEVSDLAIVADYKTILPPLIEEIKLRRG
jgi:electron transfer flavoprotein alpha subunit